MVKKNRYELSDEIKQREAIGRDRIRKVPSGKLVKLLDLRGWNSHFPKYLVGKIIDSSNDETCGFRDEGGKTHLFFYGNLQELEIVESSSQ